ncbi:MAG: EAL domain-containing protein [Methyloglobulus sp.]|nr:EAL domain-containing protein [Methyloglobulus sp.]
MGNNSLFFSLRWKLAILFGSVFLILQSVFAFVSYLNAQDNFENDRKNIRGHHTSIAETLTKDSFLVLKQFAEQVSVVNNPAQDISKEQHRAVSALDENWPRWQSIWDMENIAFFDNQGTRIKSWGKQLIDSDVAVQRVLKNESPEHQIFCPDNCYQQAIVPVLGKSGITGVFSVIRPFSEVIIKYRDATGSDIGILIADHKPADKAQVSPGGRWQYKLSGMTKPEKNLPIFEFISQNHSIDGFFNTGKRIELNNSVYEVRVLPIQQTDTRNAPPFFIFVDDITADIKRLNSDVKRIWLYGFLGLLVSLLLILLALHVSLRRITSLSKALPLLSKSHFDQFRKQISVKDSSNLGYDELDKLSFTALTLGDQLEHFEQEMRGHTFSLLEKSQELAKERDFVRQLIDVAPIMIITQELNGIILTINHAGTEGLEADSLNIIGKVFDTFLPDSDQGHLTKLNRLRLSECGDQIQLDGLLVTETGTLRDISWLHKLMPSKEHGDERVILTLGMDISERKIAEARNIRMAYYDFLTGLANRRKFQEEFAQKLASAERYGYQLALFYLDLDRFKEINDTSGHDAGDNFLKMVANLLKETIRSTDLLSRVGGDEFTLLMPHADMVGVDHIAKKINQVLKAQAFSCSGKSYAASASIGVAVFPLHGATVNELMANADLAMYQAKELGRGQYHLFNPDYDYRSKSNQIVRWRTILEDAIANDKFVLLYQPILNIKTNKVSHFECLIRLQQDDGQILMPADFVFRAEELGLIGKIDRMVLKKAVEQHIEFNRQGKKFKLSVNISKRSFEDPGIFEDFAELFSNPEVDQKRIIFEITDTASISNYQSTNVLISKIRELGCVLALNDFGVEYPSLHYLKNAPVDYVKIDGSLIRQLDKNNDDQVFVKALIEVAQTFGKKTVAEFVENEDILTLLKGFGIDYVQGYHIGKPKAMEQ